MVRVASLLLAVFVAAGCGAVATEPGDGGEPAGTLEPPPAIEAVDEPTSSPALWWLDDALEPGTAVLEGTFCSVGYATSESEDDPVEAESKSCEDLSPEEKAQVEEAERAFRKRVEPAPGSEARTIAKLALAEDRVLGLDAWRTASGHLCFADHISRPDGGGASGPGGPCLGDDDLWCSPALCLGSFGDGPPMRWTLAGVVSSGGDELRVTLASGAASRYPLTGPLVPGFAEYRVFLLDLGPDDYTKVELLRAGVVVAEHELPASLVRMRVCGAADPNDAGKECTGSAE